MRLVLLVLLAACLLAGCGGEDDPSGRATYATTWKLERVSPDGTEITILNPEGCGGADVFDHAEFEEVEGGLRVEVLNRLPAVDACTLELTIARHTIELPRPLGADRILGSCADEPRGCEPFD